jgi:putative transposase
VSWSYGYCGQWSGRRTPPHGRPDWLRREHARFITVCTIPRGHNAIAHAPRAAAILAALLNVHIAGSWRLHAVVVMHDHVHWLATVSADLDLPKTVADTKRYLSRSGGIRWQRSFFDHRLRHTERLETVCEYIRQNPVRAGLVDEPDEWPYYWRSSR